MSIRRSTLSFSLTLVLGLGILGMTQAQAGNDYSVDSANDPLNARFTHALKKLYQMDEIAIKNIFKVKNSRGESIFKCPRMQKNLWATLDPVADHIEGTSTEKVYQKFKIKADQNEVIVAVIDDGVDINHEDLKGHMWLNLPEFYGKPGVDDDGDGYVDDIYGWNFLGNKDGQNVDGTTLEVTRIYASLKAKQESGTDLTPEETALFEQTEKEVQEGLQKAQESLATYQDFASAIQLLMQNGLKVETLAGLNAVTSNEPNILKAIELAKRVYKNDFTSADIDDGINHFNTEIKFNYNPAFNSSDIVHDDPNVLDEKGYGNNDVTGPDATHGTHVSGIIAANRQNHLGINGQGLNIKIMPIRAVPDGDERDKDVGNAIRFAVDHGARIINMSFGKEYSPNKDYVDAAMKYAEAKGVLLVHAAGNDNKNTETLENNFPNRKVQVSPGVYRNIETWIEVGASSKEKGINLPADFSNYGKTSVDVFAPGKDIVSTVPGNKYASMSGTSMASPETAGVAALLLEKFPNATAIEVKNAILASTNQYANLSCALPGTADEDQPTLVNFSQLSATGGTVDAYKAMLQMEKL